MGLLDKAKEQASQLAQKGQEAAKKGQEKIETVQAKKQADALFRDLGEAVYAERTGKATAETAAEIERLVAALRAHEAAQATAAGGPEPVSPAPVSPESASPLEDAVPPAAGPDSGTDAGADAAASSEPPIIGSAGRAAPEDA